MVIMEKETIFPDGFIIKKPHDNAPDFVKAKVSIKAEEFVAFMKKHVDNGWINIDIKTSKGGKLYAQLNDWKPEKKAEAVQHEWAKADNYPTEESEGIDAENIPF